MPEAAPEPNLAWLLGEAKLAVLDHMRARLREAGHEALRAPHSQVFRHLGTDGARLTDLAEAARVTKQAFGEHIAYLEEHGYVERVPDPADGRAKLIVPTPRGVEAMAIARAAFAEFEADWARRVGAGRVREVREALRVIAPREAPHGD